MQFNLPKCQVCDRVFGERELNSKHVLTLIAIVQISPFIGFVDRSCWDAVLVLDKDRRKLMEKHWRVVEKEELCKDAKETRENSETEHIRSVVACDVE